MARETRSERAVVADVPCSAAEPDAGFTLVELVMAIGIMIIITVPTLNAVITSARADRLNTNLANVQTVLQNAVDRVNRAEKKCDYTANAQAAAQEMGWATSTTTVVQKYYVPGSTAATTGTWVTGPNGACVGTVPAVLEVQLVIVTVRSPDGKISKSLEVVKSDV